MASNEEIKIAVGSKNKGKLKAAEMALSRIFPTAKVTFVTVEVATCVSTQPLTDEESIKGAKHRAIEAQKATNANYGIGMEGGVHKIGDIWFGCGWIVVVNDKGVVGVSSTDRFELGEPTMKPILEEGKEMAEVIDAITGKIDVRSNEGAMGVLTNGILSRPSVYAEATIFAFSRFISPEAYWK